MNDQNDSNILLGQIAMLVVALVIAIRELSLPKTVFGALLQMVTLPKVLVFLVMRALMMVFSLLSLLSHTWTILKAVFSLLIVGGIVVRLGNIINRLNERTSGVI